MRSNALHSDRQKKTRINQNVIVRQARNKNRAANNDRQQRFRNTMLNLKEMKRFASVNLNKMKDGSNYRFKQLKDTNFGKRQQRKKAKEKQNTDPKKIKKNTLPDDSRPSPIQMQLEDIIKYSNLFPSRKNSILCINKNINKFMNETLHSSKESATQKPADPINSMDQISCFNIRGNPNEKSSKWKSKLASFAQGSKEEKTKDKSSLNQTFNDSSLLIEFVKDTGNLNQLDSRALTSHKSLASIQRFRKKNRINAIKKHETTGSQQNHHNKSLDFFIENELEKHRQRNTVNHSLSKKSAKLHRNSVRESRGNDQNEFPVEQSQIQQFNRLLCGGGSKESSEFSEFISGQEITEYQQKFSLYRNVYQGIVSSLVGRKIDLKDIENQDLKSVFYLNWRTKQPNTEENKRAIKETMKKIKVLD